MYKFMHIWTAQNSEIYPYNGEEIFWDTSSLRKNYHKLLANTCNNTYSEDWGSD